MRNQTFKLSFTTSQNKIFDFLPDLFILQDFFVARYFEGYRSIHNPNFNRELRARASTSLYSYTESFYRNF